MDKNGVVYILDFVVVNIFNILDKIGHDNILCQYRHGF